MMCKSKGTMTASSALHSLSAEDTIVFDTETTGTEKDLDEAVSIAAQSYASPSGAPAAGFLVFWPVWRGLARKAPAPLGKGSSFCCQLIRLCWQLLRDFGEGL